MGRFTKRLIGGLTAALTLAGGAAAGQYVVTDFDNGTNQHNLGYYYYFYGSGNPDKGNVDERAMVVSAGPADEYGPMSYIAGKGAPETPCHSGQYCGALRVNPLPAHAEKGSFNQFQPDGGYYPAFGFGLSLTKSDTSKYGAKFAQVDSIAFWAMTESPGVTVFFKLETIENSPIGNGCGGPCDGYRTDFPDVDKTNKHTNSYMISFLPTATWTRFAFAIKPVSAPTVTGPIDKATTTGKVGQLAQAGWYGTNIDFKPENVTKIAWAINSDANADLHGEEANVFIDDVAFVGAQVNESFYTPPWLCQNCVSSTFSIPTPSKVLSTFEGSDGGAAGTDYLLNSRGYYWYSYTDNVGGGTSAIHDLIENPHIEGNMIMNTEGRGREGSRGAGILFETGTAYKQDGKDIMAFVGIGANLYFDTTKTDYLNAGSFQGIYFEYRTHGDVDKVNVELTDDCDAIGDAGDKDGEVFFTQIDGTKEAWKSATISFDKFVLPGWVDAGGVRRGGKTPTCTNLNLYKLAGLKFKVEGANIIDAFLEIDNVAFYGATEWGEAGSVRFVNNKNAKAAGLRATFNRGVVGVSWSAANIASGKVSLVNIKGRTIASAPLVKAGGKVTANLGKGSIPTGMYFVRINAKDVQGKKVVQQVPLSIVK